MEYWQVVLGLLTAIFLVFLRGAQLKADKQKVVSTRLRSYLMYWRGVILENDLFSIFYVGTEWNKEISEILSNGGDASDLVALEAEKKKTLEALKAAIENGEIKISKEDLEKALKRLPDNFSDYILQYIQKYEQNLLEGKTFITDEEASQLGIHMAHVSIELKMELVSLINSGLGLFVVALSNLEDFDLAEYSNDVAKIAWKGIVVSKHIDTLSNRIDSYAEKSVFELALLNLLGKL